MAGATTGMSVPPDRYDVIVAGAGPAGSTCARICARAGLATLLVEQNALPRTKPCGGALSSRGRSLLDIPMPDSVIEQECRGIRVHYGRQVVERRTDRPIAFMIDRARFDGFLATQAEGAGARLRQRERVNGAQEEDAAVSVSTASGTYRAEYLVGADGANSVVARLVRPPLGRRELMAAMAGSVPAAAASGAAREGLLDLYYGTAPFGYGWVFPHGSMCSVGIMGLSSDFHEVPRRFAEFCRSLGLPSLPARGHTIPLGGISRPVARGRILLAGDAAGFADPFQGEGMAHAIHSGRLAAETVIDAVRGRTDAVRRYARACEQSIGRELRIALRMAWALERYPALFLSIFFGPGPALDRYLDIATNRSDYRSFRRWLLARLPGYLLRRLFSPVRAS